MDTESIQHTDTDCSDLRQLEQQLADWTFAGQHHMHKSWRFRTAQQALKWHGLVKDLGVCHSGDCYFYLGHVGSGRVETDILNHKHGRLTKEDLDVALLMNRLEDDVKQADSGGQV